MSRTAIASSARRPLIGWLLAAGCALALTGCMAPRPGADLPAFGESVRHTKAIQTYQPGDPVPTLGGAKAAEAMRGYRTPAGGAQQSSPMTTTSVSLP
ncbi:hypothetical protein [Halomonas nitroreducens]|uniref:Uncharacterized protein n=1 Tax=Halomonas nitroreducens TaxID=447425 RepID=A0A3S0JU53_9GAMM|nr:hypothetical protein [Halomonas nitroreducens]RTQ99635.1 hypothetical protein EKG36_17370 [Halomonas nitroreducens]